jgi:multidrug efflux system membrane fusion protein
MKASRITAVGLVAAAALWIASGHFMPNESAESRAAIQPGAGEAKKLFRVAVMPSSVQQHSRTLTISGRTEAEKHVTVTARTGGVLTELRVKRGSRVEKGDVIAVLSDDARTAQVAQAQSLVKQRRTELEAKRPLIASGATPRLDLVNLEAQLKAAEAALAMAEAERDRGIVRAPWSGVVSDVSVEVGQAAFSFQGRELLQLVSLDPMLAVVEVAERKLAGLTVGEEAEVRVITGKTVHGRVRYVAKTASQTTRTYRVEVELPNPNGAIPDGITAEVSLKQAAVAATRIPRSALTIASTGDIGIREVDEAGVVAFVPVRIVEDEQTYMWVAGIPDGARVIVQGQDFVREGQKVEAVAAADVAAAAKSSKSE